MKYYLLVHEWGGPKKMKSSLNLFSLDLSFGCAEIR